MSEVQPHVLVTDHGDGSADFTVAFADDDHKFSASIEGNEAVVSYEESLMYRGGFRVVEPGETIFKELMQSNEMTEFLEEYGLDSVRRERR